MLGQQEKVASRPDLLLRITNLSWRYAELNSFWVGWTKFQLYELGQQEQGQGCIIHKCGGFPLTVETFVK